MLAERASSSRPTPLVDLPQKRRAGPASHLPARLTPFVGRRTELDCMLALLREPSVRMVTLLGVGGVGKTALALELASCLEPEFEHGALFIPLAHLNSIDQLLPAIAGALDVQLPPSGDLQQAVLDTLGPLELLLVLDTFEHLTPESVLLRDMLLASPRLKLLVTSREKLGLEAETLYSLSGLELPADEDLGSASLADSVNLFLQRARQVRPTFALDEGNAPAVVGLCRMVDGNPLGILLAASRIEHFTPQEIASQAAASFDFLSRDLRDVEPRHSCLRAVFDSSFQRLDEPLRLIFRRLSVFRGGFDLAAAAAVAGADLSGLISLVERSMLARLPESGRYELHGLLHQYARQELERSGESDSLLAAHGAYYCAFVCEREPLILSDRQAAALDEIQSDVDNIRQAWTCLVETCDLASVRAMLPGLYAFTDMRSRFYEGEAMFRQAVEGLTPHPDQPPDGAWALALLSWFDMRMYIEGLESYESLIAQARTCLQHLLSIGDRQGAAASLVLLGAIAQHQDDFRSAAQHCQEAMRVDPGLDGAYWVTMRIGIAYEAAGEYARALESFQACLARGRRTGEGVKTAWSYQNIGDTLMFQRRLAEARPYLEQARALFESIGTRIGVIWSLHSLGRLALGLGRPSEAADFARLASSRAQQVHSASWVHKTAELLAQVEHQLHGPLDDSSAPAPLVSSVANQGAGPVISIAEPLSPRELEVLRLLKSELSGPEIARQLVVSLNTVRFHTKHIYQKLGVNSRLEAIRRAAELGV